MGKAELFYAYSFAGFADKVMTYNLPFLRYEEGILYLGNAIKLDYSPYQSRVWYGETLLISTALNWGATGTCYVAYSNTLFHAQFNDPGGRRIVVFYEIVDGEEYWGARGSSGNATMAYKALSELAIYRVSAGTNIEYRHLKQINYSCPANTLNYTSECIFKVLSKDVGGNVTAVEKYVTDPNLINCTDVSSQVKVTMNNRNYFTLGPNFLFEIA